MRLENLCKAGLSIGALSLVVFFLGLAGLLTAPYILSLTLVLCLLSAYFLINAFRNPQCQERLGLKDKALLMLVIITFASAFTLALLPPSARDELIQHLALPKLYLEAGRVYEIPFMSFAYLPQNLDMLYLIPLALDNDILPRVVHLSFAVLTGLAIFLYVRPLAGRTWGLFAFLVFISTPLVFNLGRIAYTDLGAGFFTTLAAMAMLKWRDGFSAKWLAYSALLTGLGAGVKYNSLITMLLLAFFVMHARVRGKKGVLDALRHAFLFLALSLAVLSPWLIRNVVWGKTPFFPVFENAMVAAASGAGVHVTGEVAPIAKRVGLYREGIFDVLTIPLRIFLEGRDNSIEKFDGVLNPFFLIFIPLAFIRKGQFRDRSILFIYSALFFAMTFLTIDIVSRYLMPIIPFFAVFTTFGVKNLYEARGLKYVSLTLAVLFFAFNINYAKGLYERYRPFQYLFGKETRHGYLTRVLPDHEAVVFANKTLPKDARVMLVFTGERGYYWERPYFYGDRTGNSFRWMVRDSGGPGPFMQRLNAMGITHIFLNDAILWSFASNNLSPEEVKWLKAFFSEGRLVFSSRGFSVYRAD